MKEDVMNGAEEDMGNAEEGVNEGTDDDVDKKVEGG